MSVASIAAFAVAMAPLAGCNSVTGAADLRLVEVDEETTDGSGGSGSSASAASGSGSTGSGSVTACVYPEGAYGPDMHDIVSPNLDWQGYAEGTTSVDQVSDIKITDLYDCDGTKGVNAILVLTSATWCGICQGEAQQLNSHMTNGWADMGIKVVTLMIEDATSKPATTNTAFQWKNQFKLNTTTVTADPQFSFAPSGGGSIGLPLILVIDPRTMEIVHVQQGASGSYPELETLAKKNSFPASP